MINSFQRVNLKPGLIREKTADYIIKQIRSFFTPNNNIKSVIKNRLRFKKRKVRKILLTRQEKNCHFFKIFFEGFGPCFFQSKNAFKTA